jgi:selenide,water dikinase
MSNESAIRLTQFSHGAGCGCKISPKVLSSILSGCIEPQPDANLIVGYENCDDAAVYDLGDGTAIISTTDFFMPIVDDAFDFGMIAATNAISDVYAMGGTPLVAIAILGWPINKIDSEIARLVVDGGRQACKNAGITLAGGHSIDSPEPIFGLAVTGRVEIKNLKQNNTAGNGDKLYLTKPLGIGILTTAQKQSKLKPEHSNTATESMIKLNSIGCTFAKLPYVSAMTDVTGFGLLGHLREMCLGSNLSAIIDYCKIPHFNEIEYYIGQNCIPGGTNRNWDSYGHDIELGNAEWKTLLCDPQTSGGLLVAVDSQFCNEFENILVEHNLPSKSIGTLVPRNEAVIKIK